MTLEDFTWCKELCELAKTREGMDKFHEDYRVMSFNMFPHLVAEVDRLRARVEKLERVATASQVIDCHLHCCDFIPGCEFCDRERAMFLEFRAAYAALDGGE